MDEGILGGVASLLGGWRLCEFHDGRGCRARQGNLSRQLRASGDAQEHVRSDQPVSRQPEYQANGVSTVAYAGGAAEGLSQPPHEAVRRLGAMPSRELLQQRFGFLQVYGVQPLAEPGIDLWQELACGIMLPLLLPEATQAHGGSQLQGLRLLLTSNLKRLTEIRFWCLLRLPLSVCRLQKQFALETIQLCLPTALCGCCHCGKSLGKDA